MDKTCTITFIIAVNLSVHLLLGVSVDVEETLEAILMLPWTEPLKTAILWGGAHVTSRRMPRSTTMAL